MDLCGRDSYETLGHLTLYQSDLCRRDLRVARYNNIDYVAFDRFYLKPDTKEWTPTKVTNHLPIYFLTNFFERKDEILNFIKSTIDGARMERVHQISGGSQLGGATSSNPESTKPPGESIQLCDYKPTESCMLSKTEEVQIKEEVSNAVRKRGRPKKVTIEGQENIKHRYNSRKECFLDKTPKPIRNFIRSWADKILQPEMYQFSIKNEDEMPEKLITYDPFLIDGLKKLTVSEHLPPIEFHYNPSYKSPDNRITGLNINKQGVISFICNDTESSDGICITIV